MSTAAIKSVPRYLSRGYHPSQEGSTEQAVAYLAASSAAMGGDGRGVSRADSRREGCRLMPKLRTVAVVAGAALLARRAMRRRIQASPLWPMPALEEPVYGRPRSRALRLLVASREEIAEGIVRLRLEGHDVPRWEPGAHLDLVLPSGRVREYSLGSPRSCRCCGRGRASLPFLEEVEKLGGDG